MKISQIISLLSCDALSNGVEPNHDIQYAYASDLMSDILVAPQPGALLLTGLTNTQAVRTCKISRVSAIVFVRNKKPMAETLQLSEQYGIPVYRTTLSMFDACGILFAHGLKGVARKSS